MNHIAYLRREYIKGELRRQDLPFEPIVLFEYWLKQAYKANIIDPTAMIVATVDENNQPWQRIVLLKDYDKDGLIFYSNLDSRKAQHIEHNPQVSLLFPWHTLERQVMVIGKVECIPTLEAIKYFYSRPRNSQISTWVSRQSKYISTRKILDKKFLYLREKFQYGEIPFPNFWAGFRVFIEQMEFWQGGKYRLHDRFLYQRNNGKWKINRLSP